MDASYPALFDELSKIAEEEQKYVDREKFKRHLKTVGAIGLGTGLGVGAGKLVGDYLQSKRGVDQLKKLPPWALKYGPAVAGGLAGGGVIAHKLLRHKTDRYIEHGDESKRPK